MISVLAYWQQPTLQKTVGLIILAIVLIILFQRPGGYEKDDDPFEYAALAGSLFSGEGIQFNGHPDVVLPPGFPMIVGLMSIFIEPSGIAVRLASLAGFLLTLVAFVMVSKQILPGGFSRLAVLFYCSSSAVLFNAVSGYADSFFSAWMWCMTWLAFGTNRKHATLLSTAGYAVLWTLLILTKPEGILVGALLLPFYLSTAMRKYVHGITLIAGLIILNMPYLWFLRSTTGAWQLSGKTYANLVLGESSSPYKTGHEQFDSRYDIISRIQSDPAEAKTLRAYLEEEQNDLFERVPGNLIELSKTLYHQFWSIGLGLAVFGVYTLQGRHRILLLCLISPLVFYSAFFYVPRIIGIYHGVVAIAIAAGLSAFMRTKWLAGRQVLAGRIVVVFSVMVALLLVRSVLKAVLPGWFPATGYF